MTMRKYSTNLSLNPWFITGFSDAEGTFIINVNEKKDTKLKWGVRATFKISLHPIDRAILEQIKLTLGVGNIYTSQSLVSFEVNSLKDLNIILDHFNNYPLLTQKNVDFELFKSAIAILNKKEHLTLPASLRGEEEGLLKILNIKASMNWGLSEKLVQNFPNVIPVIRYELKNQQIEDPNWIAGFTSGEGCFMIRVRDNLKSPVGTKVELIFQLTQHIRDKNLIESLIKYLDCGKYRIRTGGLAGDYLVYKLSDITSKIIVLFDKYPISGYKLKDYEDFKLVAKLMNEKSHLTKKGIKEIKKIVLNKKLRKLP